MAFGASDGGKVREGAGKRNARVEGGFCMPGGKGLQGECRTVRFAGGLFSWVESSSLGYTAHGGRHGSHRLLSTRFWQCGWELKGSVAPCQQPEAVAVGAGTGCSHSQSTAVLPLPITGRQPPDRVDLPQKKGFALPAFKAHPVPAVPPGSLPALTRTLCREASPC